MARYILIVFLAFTGIVSSASCNPEAPTPKPIKFNDTHTDTPNENIPDSSIMSYKIRIKIGSMVFSATLAENPTATAFKTLLPLSISMTELNGNEKYFRLSKNLPINPSVPSSIQTGDLMMYGSNTLVLFYETFSTSYSYTKVGKINDPSGLAEALGQGDIKVTIALE